MTIKGRVLQLMRDGYFTLVPTLLFSFVLTASAQTENVIYRFPASGASVAGPQGGLIADSAGNLYGVTANGGTFGSGCIFRLVPPSSAGGRWTKTTLYSFTGGTDGSAPGGRLIFDGKGNLYGVTYYGGAFQNPVGVVYELMPPTASRKSWTESVIHSFQSNGSTDGAFPVDDLSFDQAGNLYGVTSGGGQASGGTVFQLTPPTMLGAAWTENVLYSFLSSGSSDGYSPTGGVLLGPGGVLYGTTGYDGMTGCGTVYELSSLGKSWTESILYNFQGYPDGCRPEALTAGKNGTFVGTTGFGGAANQGMVFEMTPPTDQSGWTISAVYSFSEGVQTSPSGGVIVDSSGNLYGGTYGGADLNCRAPNGCGSAYKLSPPAISSGSWTFGILYVFTGGLDGADPNGRLLLTRGELFGETVFGGTSTGGGYGTVFRVTP
jgi:uncharacterized repeat protein (TIGR03803 family)